MKVNAQYAESHLADLLSAAYSGEEVEIEAPNKPALRLVISNPTSKPSATSQEPRQLGRLKGLIEIPTDEEWAAVSKETEDLMLNAPLTTSGEI